MYKYANLYTDLTYLHIYVQNDICLVDTESQMAIPSRHTLKSLRMVHAPLHFSWRGRRVLRRGGIAAGDGLYIKFTLIYIYTYVLYIYIYICIIYIYIIYVLYIYMCIIYIYIVYIYNKLYVYYIYIYVLYIYICIIYVYMYYIYMCVGCVYIYV